MKIRTAIVEDDKRAEETLAQFIDRFSKENGDEISVKAFPEASSFLKEGSSSFDLLFLDIEMPGDKNGLDLAREIRKSDSRVVILFVTQMAQYALQGYEVDALDFLVKPVNYYSFAMKMNKVIRYLSLTQNKKETVILRVNHDTKLLSRDIYYVEVVNHDLYYHTTHGEYHARDALKNVEKKLEGLPFSRCHVDYLVNLDYVSGIEKNEVVLTSGDRLAMPRSRRNDFLADLNRYLGAGGGNPS